MVGAGKRRNLEKRKNRVKQIMGKHSLSGLSDTRGKKNNHG